MTVSHFYLIVLLISLMTKFSSVTALMTESNFQARYVCLKPGCPTVNHGTLRRLMDCATLCHSTSTCMGFGDANDGNCLQLYEGCVLDTCCDQDVPRFTVYEKGMSPSLPALLSSSLSLNFSSCTTTMIHNDTATAAVATGAGDTTFTETTNEMTTISSSDTTNEMTTTTSSTDPTNEMTTTSSSDTTNEMTTTSSSDTTNEMTTAISYALTTTPVCLNDGQWDEQLDACRCQNGFVGGLCERDPYNCEELGAHWYPPGDYTAYIDIHRNQSRRIYTHCYVSSETSAYTYIFLNNGWHIPDISSQDYINGFTTVHTSHWLGLENVWLFNQLGYTNVAFGVTMYGKDKGSLTWWYSYVNFQIQDASAGYAFTFDQFNPITTGSYFLTNNYTLENILGQAQGVRFSTADSDHDLEPSVNCAARAGTGWWFKTCPEGVTVNFMGYNPRSSVTSDPDKKLVIRGFDMGDPEVQDYFSVVYMQFYT